MFSHTSICRDRTVPLYMYCFVDIIFYLLYLFFLFLVHITGYMCNPKNTQAQTPNPFSFEQKAVLIFASSSFLPQPSNHPSPSTSSSPPQLFCLLLPSRRLLRSLFSCSSSQLSIQVRLRLPIHPHSSAPRPIRTHSSLTRIPSCQLHLFL